MEKEIYSYTNTNLQKKNKKKIILTYVRILQH